MRHTLFALFEDAAQAAAALKEVSAAGIPEAECSVILHRDKLKDSDLAGFETEQRAGPVVGFLTGGALGAVAGAVVGGPLGLVGIGWLMSSALCASAGSAYGLVFGALTGSSLPDHTLSEMAGSLEAGNVLVAVDIKGGVNEDNIERIFAHHGAVTRHKAIWAHPAA